MKLLFNVVRRALSRIGVEDPAEIKLVPVAHHFRNVLDKELAALFHELLCPLHAYPGQVLIVGLPGILAEQLAHIRLGNGEQIGDSLEGQRFGNVVAEVDLDLFKKLRGVHLIVFFFLFRQMMKRRIQVLPQHLHVCGIIEGVLKLVLALDQGFRSVPASG